MLAWSTRNRRVNLNKTERKQLHSNDEFILKESRKISQHPNLTRSDQHNNGIDWSSAPPKYDELEFNKIEFTKNKQTDDPPDLSASPKTKSNNSDEGTNVLPVMPNTDFSNQINNETDVKDTSIWSNNFFKIKYLMISRIY